MSLLETPLLGAPLAPEAKLAYLRAACEAMRAGQPVPEDAARYIAPAFEIYLLGECRDLTTALGLRPRQGGRYETPAQIVRGREREKLILRVAGRVPDRDKARACARLIAGNAVIDDPEIAAAVEKLRTEFADDLPGSVRQYRRILAAGRTSNPGFMSLVALCGRWSMQSPQPAQQGVHDEPKATP